MQGDQELISKIRGQYIRYPPPASLLLNLTHTPTKEELGGQFGQARKLEELLQGKKGGFFIEAGAVDGQTLSNSLLFELNHNWTGLLVEANPYSYNDLVNKNRR